MGTLAAVLCETFPRPAGRAVPYLAFPEAGRDAADAYASPPMLPFDLFAIAARLMLLSGAYHHIAPPTRKRAVRLLTITPEEQEQARAVAKAWRAMDGFAYLDPAAAASFHRWRTTAEGEPLAPLFAWWDEVFAAHGSAPVADSGAAAPVWWRPALLLFIAADEAAAGVGFHPAVAIAGRKIEAPWFERFVYLIFLFVGRSMRFEADGTAATSAISTFSCAEKSVACVLPKARTPSVGCTLRSLSHNLALMPPQGIATGRWMPYVFTEAPPDERHLNLLLVPFPYAIAASAFQPRNDEVACGSRGGFFGLEQQWLKNLNHDTMIEFVVALATEARREVDNIHAIVFPELALDGAFYEALVASLPSKIPGLEFLVAGVSNLDKRIGNFVNVTVFQMQGGKEAGANALGLTSAREKHHRWRLDRDQIISYGLQGTLSPSLFWWEDIDLLSRRVDFAVIRAGSVISALICEDLARVDPCQALIRSVGPSIIFALLMDAPQIKERWPARHATILAEDPGSAVLTMTSKAMMNRQDRLGIFRSRSDKDRVIALWRDDSKATPDEIVCGKDQYGVLLTLSGSHVVDESLDGRQDPGVVAWRFAGQRQLGLGKLAEKFAEIVMPDQVPSHDGVTQRG